MFNCKDILLYYIKKFLIWVLGIFSLWCNNGKYKRKYKLLPFLKLLETILVGWQDRMRIYKNKLCANCCAIYVQINQGFWESLLRKAVMADNVHFLTNFMNLKCIDLQNGRASKTFNYSNVISYPLLKKGITQKIDWGSDGIDIIGFDGDIHCRMTKTPTIGSHFFPPRNVNFKFLGKSH